MQKLRAGDIAKALRQIAGDHVLRHPHTGFHRISGQRHVLRVDQAKPDVGFKVNAALPVQHAALHLCGTAIVRGHFKAIF